MMKQHDTGPMQPSALAQETVDAVRRALHGYMLDSPSTELAPELRDALRALAHEARRNAVPPEQLLITLKAIWRTTPPLEAARDPDERTRALQRIVTICIKAYFAD
jgi:hypothetical protein